jgi:hypothetical protein
LYGIGSSGIVSFWARNFRNLEKRGIFMAAAARGDGYNLMAYPRFEPVGHHGTFLPFLGELPLFHAWNPAIDVDKYALREHRYTQLAFTETACRVIAAVACIFAVCQPSLLTFSLGVVALFGTSALYNHMASAYHRMLQ